MQIVELFHKMSHKTQKLVHTKKSKNIELCTTPLVGAGAMATSRHPSVCVREGCAHTHVNKYTAQTPSCRQTDRQTDTDLQVYKNWLVVTEQAAKRV